MKKDIARASRLYRAFREETPKVARSVRVNLPKAVAVMGTCEFIGYMTTHNGKTTLYVHEFAPGSRPLLTAGTGRGQLYLIGGRYRVTSRGIVDHDTDGREVHARRKYRVSTSQR